jgi:Mn2+/Fe2+ NRAMP family transporter
LPARRYPILRAAADRRIMGKHLNSRFVTVLGWVFLVLITGAAIAAIPLMVLTHSGTP